MTHTGNENELHSLNPLPQRLKQQLCIPLDELLHVHDCPPPQQDGSLVALRSVDAVDLEDDGAQLCGVWGGGVLDVKDAVPGQAERHGAGGGRVDAFGEEVVSDPRAEGSFGGHMGVGMVGVGGVIYWLL